MHHRISRACHCSAPSRIRFNARYAIAIIYSTIALTYVHYAARLFTNSHGNRNALGQIDEPNTPYTHYDHQSDEESTSSGRHPRSPDENHPHAAPTLATQWDDIESKLQAVADKRGTTPDGVPLSPALSRESHGSFSDSEDEARKMERDIKFRLMRKKHYNEVEAMKKWRKEHPGGDDVDDDDENAMQE